MFPLVMSGFSLSSLHLLYFQKVCLFFSCLHSEHIVSKNFKVFTSGGRVASCLQAQSTARFLSGVRIGGKTERAEGSSRSFLANTLAPICMTLCF